MHFPQLPHAQAAVSQCGESLENNHQYKEEIMDLQLIFTAIVDGTSEMSWTKLMNTATTLPLFMTSCLNQTNNDFKCFLEKYCKSKVKEPQPGPSSICTSPSADPISTLSMPVNNNDASVPSFMDYPGFDEIETSVINQSANITKPTTSTSSSIFFEKGQDKYIYRIQEPTLGSHIIELSIYKTLMVRGVAKKDWWRHKQRSALISTATKPLEAAVLNLWKEIQQHLATVMKEQPDNVELEVKSNNRF